MLGTVVLEMKINLREKSSSSYVQTAGRSKRKSQCLRSILHPSRVHKSLWRYVTVAQILFKSCQLEKATESGNIYRQLLPYEHGRLTR